MFWTLILLILASFLAVGLLIGSLYVAKRLQILSEFADVMKAMMRWSVFSVLLLLLLWSPVRYFWEDLKPLLEQTVSVANEIELGLGGVTVKFSKLAPTIERDARDTVALAEQIAANPPTSTKPPPAKEVAVVAKNKPAFWTLAQLCARSDTAARFRPTTGEDVGEISVGKWITQSIGFGVYATRMTTNEVEEAHKILSDVGFIEATQLGSVLTERGKEACALLTLQPG